MHLQDTVLRGKDRGGKPSSTSSTDPLVHQTRKIKITITVFFFPPKNLTRPPLNKIKENRINLTTTKEVASEFVMYMRSAGGASLRTPDYVLTVNGAFQSVVPVRHPSRAATDPKLKREIDLVTIL